jgi:hypothetical protein
MFGAVWGQAVHLIESTEPPSGVGEVSVPSAARR